MNIGKEKNEKIGYAFISPYIFFLLAFTAYPLIFSFYLIFHRWDLLTSPAFVGLDNFIFLLHDTQFWQALLNTLVFLLIHIPLQIFFSIIIAMVLAEKIFARTFFRAAFFLPVIISGAVVTILWQKLYATDTGIFNHMLSLIGISPVGWLTDTKIAMPAIAIMATWKNMGFYIILFLGGLLSIPGHLYEVSKIEGATRWQDFSRITLPLLRPTMLLVVVLSTFGAFSLFIEPYVMTGGGPLNTTMSVVLYMYKHAFLFQHMGYAATIGFALAIVILMVVLVQKKYLGEETEY
ncbi:MAG: sugar ABC transporter permease [Elusimicrobiales bacterium]|nr:sugar ABC transporter permease [Elusimicrobiales bacterium]